MVVVWKMIAICYEDAVDLHAISWYNDPAKWYKMRKVQVRAFGRLPEGEKYKNGTSQSKKREKPLSKFLSENR